MTRRLRIAVTLGDPRGIGPEVAVRAAGAIAQPDAEIILVGPQDAIDVSGLDLLPTGTWQDSGGPADAGLAAVAAIKKAVALAMGREIDALVTAPISKPALAAAGFAWPGHTEMLRELSGVLGTSLCLTCESTPLGGPLRVVLVTGHIALRDVAAAYTIERVVAAALRAHDGLVRLWGIERPRLAVCALNPHASDEGLFGDEEERVCLPAIRQLRARGLDCIGPLPADTVFVRAMRGDVDAVLAPYHDVGMTAIKTACLGAGVNVTLGLPFPRTSPDHGTALDIAGSGTADPRSMSAALELAIRFARRSLTAPSSPDRLAPG